MVGDDTRERLALTADTSLSRPRGKTDAVAIAPITRRSAKVMDAYLADRKVITLDGPPFRTRRGVAYTKNSPAEDFRDIRALVWPGDSRTLMGMRRSGALEASAGAVDPKALRRHGKHDRPVRGPPAHRHAGPDRIDCSGGQERGSPLADIRHRDIDAFSDIGTISSGQIAEG